MHKYYFVFNEGSKINQILCAIIINLPVFAYGATIGWMSPMTLLLQSKDTPTAEPLTDAQISWMAASAHLVCIPFDYIIAYVGDRIGRRRTLQLMSLTSVALWIIKLCSMEPWAFILARALVGISMAGCYVTCPVYTKEISDDSVRGVLGTLVYLFHTSGNLFVYVIGDILSYNTILWICFSMPVIHLLLFTVIPESPSYLIKCGDEEKARSVIAWLRCRNEDDATVLKELDTIKSEREHDSGANKFIFKSIVQDKILLRAYYIAMVVTVAAEVCGAVAVINFAGDIFSNSSQTGGVLLQPNQQAMLLGAVQVAGSVMASGVVEKAGRKPLLFVSSLISGISMCLLASWFLARRHGILTPAWLPIAALCVCIFCDSVGLQPISIVIIGEIFSFKYRGAVLGSTMALASTTDFIQLLFFKPLARKVGIHFAFYFFGIMCLLNALYVLFFIPETKKRSLSEIYQDLKTKSEKDLRKVDQPGTTKTETC